MNILLKFTISFYLLQYTCAAVPSSVSDLNITNVNPKNITVTFSIPLNATTVELQIKDIAGNTTNPVNITNATFLPFTFVDLLPNRIYAIIVVATNNDGAGQSMMYNVTTREGIPSMINLTSVEALMYYETTKALLKWGAPQDLGGLRPEDLTYKLEWCTNATSCQVMNYTNAGNDVQANISFPQSPLTKLNITITPINKIGEEGPKYMREYDIPNRDTCMTEYFSCVSGSIWCIPKNKTCNHVKDCDDESDEMKSDCVPQINLNPQVVTILWNKVDIAWVHNSTYSPMAYNTTLVCINNYTESKAINCSSNCTISYSNINNTNCVFTIFAHYRIGDGMKYNLSVNAPSIEPPGIPKSLRIQRGKSFDQRVFVWESPENTGNQLAEDLEYEITICSLMECFVNMTAKAVYEYRVSNVMSATTYNFSVKAVNLLGVKGAAKILDFTSPNLVPTGLVTNVTARPFGDQLSNSQQIMWYQPTELNGNDILNVTYNLKYCAMGSECISVAINSTNSTPILYTIQNLTRSTNYTFQIIALNRFSDYRDPIVQSFMTQQCNANEFVCATMNLLSDTGNCARLEDKCNKMNDCYDGSDESMEYANCTFTGPVRNLTFFTVPTMESNTIKLQWLSPILNNNNMSSLLYVIKICSYNGTTTYNCSEVKTVNTTNTTIETTVDALMRNQTYKASVFTRAGSNAESTFQELFFTTLLCNTDEKQCQQNNSYCVSMEKWMEWRCNGIHNCIDNRDETDAGCKAPNPPSFNISKDHETISIHLILINTTNEMITGFKLFLSFLNGTVENVTLPANRSNFTFEKLERNTVYMIEVVAVNRVGEASSKKNITTDYCNMNTEFACASKTQCIPTMEKCDNMYQCNDTSDESVAFANCMLPLTPNVTISSLYDGLMIKFYNVSSMEKNTRIEIEVTVENMSIKKNVSSFDDVRIQNSTYFMPGHTYNVSVTSVNLAGSSPMFMKQFMTLGPRINPVVNVTKTNYTTIEIVLAVMTSMTNNTILEFQIEITNAMVTTSYNTTGNATTFTLTKLNHSTSYMVRYRAQDSDGYSTWSNALQLNTTTLGRPKPVSKLNSDIHGHNYVILRWESSSGDFITSQNIYYSNERMNETMISVSSNVEMYRVSNLTENTMYQFSVVAVNEIGESVRQMANITTDSNLCPGADWVLSYGDCFFFDNNNGSGATRNLAEGNCQILNSQLTSITSNMTDTFLMQYISYLSYSGAHIGLTQTPNQELSWSDHSNVSFRGFRNGSVYTPDNYPQYNNATTCGLFTEITWEMIDCNCGVRGTVNCPNNDVYGYICKRKNVTVAPIIIRLISAGWNSLNLTWPKTSLESRNFQIKVNNMFYYTSNYNNNYLLQNLTELTTYQIEVREMYQGFGPWSLVNDATTRGFIPPAPAENFTITSVQHQESQAVSLNWTIGANHGDSMMENIYGMVEYYFNGSDKMTKYMLRPGDNITALTPNTNYTFSLKLYDIMYNKSSNATETVFKTANIDECRTAESLCIGLNYCILQTSLCDGVYDCSNHADEKNVSGCSLPKTVNITQKTEGFDFIKLYWTDEIKMQRILFYNVTISNEIMNVTDNATATNVAVITVPGSQTSYRFNSLQPNTMYNVTIRSVNPTGEGNDTLLFLKTMNSSDPTGPVINITSKPTKNYEDSQYTISWAIPDLLANNDADKLSYFILYCEYNKTESCSNATVSTTQIMLKNLTNGMLYKVNVTAITEYGKSSPIESVMFNTAVCNSLFWQCRVYSQCVQSEKRCDGVNDCTDGTDELSKAGCLGPDRVNVSVELIGTNFVWFAFPSLQNQRVTNYNIVLKNSSSNEIYTRERNGTYTKEIFKVDGLSPGMWYSLTITVTNPTNISERRINITTLAMLDAPGTVRDVQIAPTMYMESSSFTMKWAYPLNTGGSKPDELRYKIQYCVNGTGDCMMKNVTNGMMNTTINTTINSLKFDTTYEVQVFALNGDRQGNSSKNLHTTGKQDTCMLGYYRCPVICLSQDHVCDNIRDCMDAYDERTNCTDVPPAVINIRQLEADALYNRLVVSWNISHENKTGDSILTYFVSAECGNYSKMMEVNKTMAVFDETHKGFEPVNVNCTVSVVSKNFVGNSTLSQTILQTISLSTPSEPRSVTVKDVIGWESSNKTITWLPPINLGHARLDEIQYKIEYCIVNGTELINCSTINGITGNSYVIGNLLENTKYSFKVQAGNPLMMFSNVSTIEAQSLAMLNESTPSVPRNFASTKNDDEPHKKIDLTWNHPETLPGLTDQSVVYRITFIEVGTVEDKPLITEPGATKYTLENLNDNTKYSIKLQAASASGRSYGPAAEIVHTTNDEGLANWKIAVIVIAVVLFLIAMISFFARAHFNSKYKSEYSTVKPEKSRTNDGYADDAV